MANQNTNGDGFTTGSLILCKTCFNQDFEGEVVAFDQQAKIVILKCPSTSGNPKLNDVHFVNLGFVSDVQIKREAGHVPDQVGTINVARLNTRTRIKVDEKRRLVSALSSASSNVSTEGQLLFTQISKIFIDCTWREQDILIRTAEVSISPPYGVEDIHGSKESKGYSFIKKLVEAHLKGQTQASETTTNGASSPPRGLAAQAISSNNNNTTKNSQSTQNSIVIGHQ